jgi:hypothetical protein
VVVVTAVVGTLITAGVTAVPPADSVSPTAETPGIAAVEPGVKDGTDAGALATAIAALLVAAGGVPVGGVDTAAEAAGAVPVGARTLVVGVTAAAVPALVTAAALTVAR